MTVHIPPPPHPRRRRRRSRRALSILQGALAGADDGELFLERSESESLVFDDGRLKSAAYDATEGFGLRVVAGETAGYAHASEISEAAIAPRRRQPPPWPSAATPGVAAEGPARHQRQALRRGRSRSPRPAFSDKVALLQEIDAWARARDPRVVQVIGLAGRRAPRRSRSCAPTAG